MAIGTLAAVTLGAAVIGAGASAASAASTNKQIKKASNQTSADNAASRALQEKIYNSNKGILSPYAQRGDAAGSTINALLGLGGSSAEPGSVDWAGYVNGNPDALANWNQIQGTQADTFSDIGQFGQYHYGADGSRRDLSPYTATAQTTADQTAAAQNAFANYRNSTGYQFRLDEGMKGLNAINAARGSLDSGAAVKSALTYGQNIGSAEFGNYLGYLGNQQGVGLSAGSALAGVGSNYANAATNINSANSANAWNAAQAKTQNNNALVGNLSSSFGLAAGALSGFGGGSPYGGNLGGIY